MPLRSSEVLHDLKPHQTVHQTPHCIPAATSVLWPIRRTSPGTAWQGLGPVVQMPSVELLSDVGRRSEHEPGSPSPYWGLSLHPLPLSPEQHLLCRVLHLVVVCATPLPLDELVHIVVLQWWGQWLHLEGWQCDTTTSVYRSMTSVDMMGHSVASQEGSHVDTPGEEWTRTQSVLRS